MWFGLISYPLYLWHWPLLSMARIVMREEPPIWYRAAAFPICVVLAWLTTKFIENPLRFGKFGNIKTIILFVVMLCVGCFGFVIYKKEGVPGRFSLVVQELLEIQRKGFETNPSWSYKCGSSGVDKPQFDACTLLGKHESKPTLAIWGDSHAAAITYGFKKYFDNSYNIW